MTSQRGSIRRRGDTWTALWRSPDGRQRSKGGFRTRKEAAAHLTTALAAVQDGSHVERSRLTLGIFLTDHWLPTIKATVRPGTLRNYAEHVRVYIAPRIGAVPLQAVSAATLNALYAELGESGRQLRPGGLSPATVRRVHATLHRALRDAARWKLLAWNPADTADPAPGPRVGLSQPGYLDGGGGRALSGSGGRRPPRGGVGIRRHHRHATGRSARAALGGPRRRAAQGRPPPDHHVIGGAG
jgi:integrase